MKKKYLHLTLIISGILLLALGASILVAKYIENKSTLTSRISNAFSSYPLYVYTNGGNGSGTITVGLNGRKSNIQRTNIDGQIFKFGDVVKLTATPYMDSTFVSWKGCDSLSGELNSVCNIKISASTTVIANFKMNSKGAALMLSELKLQQQTTNDLDVSIMQIETLKQFDFISKTIGFNDVEEKNNFNSAIKEAIENGNIINLYFSESYEEESIGYFPEDYREIIKNRYLNSSILLAGKGEGNRKVVKVSKSPAVNLHSYSLDTTPILNKNMWGGICGLLSIIQNLNYVLVPSATLPNGFPAPTYTAQGKLYWDKLYMEKVINLVKIYSNEIGLLNSKYISIYREYTKRNVRSTGWNYKPNSSGEIDGSLSVGDNFKNLSDLFSIKGGKRDTVCHLITYHTNTVYYNAFGAEYNTPQKVESTHSSPIVGISMGSTVQSPSEAFVSGAISAMSTPSPVKSIVIMDTMYQGSHVHDDNKAKKYEDIPVKTGTIKFILKDDGSLNISSYNGISKSVKAEFDKINKTKTFYIQCYTFK
jgi:hypothetical protein